MRRYIYCGIPPYTLHEEISDQYLYPKTGYDLCVDSSEASPEALAEEIIGALS